MKLSLSVILSDMDPMDVYKFCLKCGGKLTPKAEFSLQCSDCGFRFFQNGQAAIGAIIENDQGQILVTKRAYDPGKGQWDLPGGFTHPYETAEQTIKREIKEELGVEIAIDHYVTNYPNRYSNQGIDIPTLDIYFKVHIVSGEIKVADDVGEYQFISKEEILNLPMWCESNRKALQAYLQKN